MLNKVFFIIYLLFFGVVVYGIFVMFLAFCLIPNVFIRILAILALLGITGFAIYGIVKEKC